MRFTLGGVLALAAASVAASVDPSTYVPLVFWSQNGIFEQPTSDVFAEKADAPYTTTQIASTIATIQGSANSDALNAHTPYEVMYLAPKAIAIFVRDSLRLDELEHFEGAAFESLVRDAKSSVAYPHTTRGDADDALTRQVKATHETTIENVEAFLQSTTLGASGTDVVIVKASNTHSWAELDNLIKQATGLFQKATGNSVYFALTGDKASAAHDVFAAFHRNLLAAAAVVTPLVCPEGYILSTAGSVPFCFSHYVNMTPTILSAIFVGFFFLFCVYVGLVLLDGIQTPLHYPSVGPPKGKEY
ncbi:hypothetical protein SDRG_09253 [Saprolegnia diclina VS20]|uniref:Protein BIG1 n=1 Tax=Saprolegnia diclina (strain VS20) TaxID=1156394 RepID=T0QEV2_SAPDV|nr:hypothetical protein SDRG_09253 [Saprolegnia diclina VS20]EQC33271.1 hypothetical protein SDRG_09253 [Saprolegnia diclina VS20]|eukprot:XP_008613394.1 hypothetical protein SDRG_09253 [Saprolegnia diclina VS20]